MKKQILFVPSGGLGNRLRAVASAYELHRTTDVPVRVMWFKDWALNARFSEIFSPSPLTDGSFMIEDASPWQYWVYDRPRRHNLFVPGLFQRLCFTHRIDEKCVTSLKEKNFDFCKWASDSRGPLYMSCYQVFGHPQPSIYSQLFKPSESVQSLLDNYLREFGHHTIGLHIRRTDNVESCKMSPISLFEEVVRKEKTLHPETCVFLASDDEAVKARFLHNFPQQVIVARGKAERGTVEGIRQAFAEMLALASCDIIYGSAGSSFSAIASQLKGGTPLKILSV